MRTNLQSISSITITNTPTHIPNPSHLLHQTTLTLTLTILLLLLLPQSSPTSPQVTLHYNNQPITIYSNNSLNPLFSPPVPGFSCNTVYKFTYNQTEEQMGLNQGYLVSVGGIVGEFWVRVASVHGKLEPTQNGTRCFGDCGIVIQNNCQNQRQFDAISISITGLPQISYNIICDSNLIFSPFQYGLIILVLFSLLQIIFSSKFQQCNSFSNNGHYINYLSLGLYLLILIIGQTLILLQIPNSMEVISSVLMGISMVVGVWGVMVCVCQGMFWAGVEGFRVGVVVGRVEVRVMEGVGVGIGVGLACAWYFSGKNWIIADIIYSSIFLATVKTIKFGSLQMATITFLSTATCNILFITLTQTLHSIYFNNLIPYLFNNPFFIYCPCISFTPNQTCSWLFISCIVYPSILLSYLDRFDQSKGSRIYFVVFVVCLVLCSGVWMVVSRFVPFTLPFDLINSPICIGLLCVFANRRGQLQSLWKGQIFDAKHRNKSQQQNELIISLKQDKSQSFKSQWFRLQYTNLSSGSVQSAIRNVRNQIQLKGLDGEFWKSDGGGSQNRGSYGGNGGNGNDNKNGDRNGRNERNRDGGNGDKDGDGDGV